MFAYSYLYEIYRQRGEFEKFVEAGAKKFCLVSRLFVRAARADARNILRRFDGQRAYLKACVSDLKRGYTSGRALDVARFPPRLVIRSKHSITLRSHTSTEAFYSRL